MSHSKSLPYDSILAQQVQWQSPRLMQSGIDQARLAIANAPTEPAAFSFVVIGDTDAGDLKDGSATAAFSQGFAQQLLPQLSESRFLLHTGDVTYPKGSYQNYLAGFLQPYGSLLSQVPSSPAYRSDDIVFSHPLFPVPGNHDYADSSSFWQRLCRSVCDVLRQKVGIDLGCYGGEGGEAYGQTFLDDLAKLSAEQLKSHLLAHYGAPLKAHSLHLTTAPQTYCLDYRPGVFTRLPNRYYTFRYGGVDFFALDSNTWNTASDKADFDHEQLAWLEQALIRSWQTPNTLGRIIYLHHSPYTTEETRWQDREMLWVRRHLRRVFNQVVVTLSKSERRSTEWHNNQWQAGPVVDLVLSGHAHCLEHVQTGDTAHADARMDWVVCGGSGIGLRRQWQAGSDILETISDQGREYTSIVAQSHLFAGVHSKGRKKQRFHSFLRIDVRPNQAQKFSVHPFVTAQTQSGWQTKSLNPLTLYQRLEMSLT